MIRQRCNVKADCFSFKELYVFKSQNGITRDGTVLILIFSELFFGSKRLHIIKF